MSHLEILGKLVKDATSGFEGIAIQTMEMLNGNVQIGIQPQLKEPSDKYPDAMFIDYHMIDVIGDGISARVTKVPSPTTIKLGQRIKDIATEFSGIAESKATYLNGCESFLVLPKAVKTDLLNENSRGSWISATRAKLVDDGVLGKVKVPVADITTGKNPGGPAQKLSNR